MPVLSRRGGEGGGVGGGVSSLDGLTGAVTLSAWDGITLTPAGQDIEIAAVAGMALIEDQLLGGAGTFDFQNIPATYKHLLIEWQVRGTQAATAIGLLLRFNNDSGGNYDDERLLGSGATPSAEEALAQTAGRCGLAAGTSAAASHSGIGQIRVPNYAEATFLKRWLSSFGYAIGTVSTNLTVGQQSGTWRSAAAVSRITIIPSAGATFVTGSRATLYGLA